MNFGWLNADSSEETIAPIVLQQFGHALGLYNENMNPDVKIEWDDKKITKHSEKYLLTSEAIHRNFYAKWPSATFPFSKEFDIDSVMFSAALELFIKDRKSGHRKTTLSDGDKAFVRKLYPEN